MTKILKIRTLKQLLKFKFFGVLAVSLIAGLCLTVGLLNSNSSEAASYDYVNFQGKLTDASGFGIASSTKTIRFSIFDDATLDPYITSCTGHCKWTETQSVTTDARGIFSVQVGSSNPTGFKALFSTYSDIYLGVKVDTDAEMTPRHPVGSVPSALNSQTLLGNTWAAPGAIGSTTPNSGAFTSLSASGVLTSTVASGTAPFTISSNTMVANLNADLLDGSHASAFAPATGGSGYVQLQGSTPGSAQTGNFNISGTGIVSTVIGGTVANNALTLQGNSATTGNTLTNAAIQLKVGDSGATTAMTILNNGNVGIGTTNPGNKLSLYAGSAGDDTLPALGANGGKFGIFNGTSPAYGFLAGVLSSGNVFQQAQRIDGTATAYNLLLQPNGGNVGIGTTSPGSPLEIYKDGSVANTTGGGLIASRYHSGSNYRGGAIYSMYITNRDYLVFGVTGDNSKNPYSDFDQARMVIGDNGNVGIGTTSPTQKLTINSGHLRFDPIPAPTAPTATLAGVGAGNLGNGIYSYAVSFVTSDNQETTVGSAGTVTVVNNTINGQVNLTNIPVSSDPRVTKRKIHRTTVGGGTWNIQYLGIINDNTTTTFGPDNVADGGLGIKTAYQDNTTAGILYKGTSQMMRIGEYNTAVGISSGGALTSGGLNAFFGYQAGASMTSGGQNALIGRAAGLNITTGSRNVAVGDAMENTGGAVGYNVAVGTYAGNSLTSSNNVLIGDEAGMNLTNSWANVALGMNAGHSATTGNSNVFLGYSAGYYETGSNKLFIDNAQRASEADARTKALMYGIFNAATANQYLTVNGQLQVTGTGNSYVSGNVGIGTTSPGYALDVNGSINIPAGTTTSSTAGYRINTNRVAYQDGGGNQYQGWVDQGNYIRFALSGDQSSFVGSSERMRITSTGNVGIGNTSPTAKLQVTEGAGVSSGATTMTVTGQPTTTFTTSVSTTLYAGDYIIPTTTTTQPRTVATTATGTSFTVTSNFTANIAGETFTIYRPSANITDNAGTTSRLFIQGGTGNVGIGTNTPSANALEIKSSHDSQLRLTTDSSGWPWNYIEFNNKTSRMAWMGTYNGFTNIFSVNGQLNLDTSNGNVGIGTTDPQPSVAGRKTVYLYQNGSGTEYIADDGTVKAKYFTNTTVAGIATISNSPVTISVNSSEKLRVDTTGNVGIGTTSPVQKMTVSGTDNAILQISSDGANRAHSGSLDLVESSAYTFGAANGYGWRILNEGSANKFVIQSGNQTTVTDRLTIERDTGNVGVGTTSPTGRLHSYISNAAVTASQYTGYFENLATNTTTDGINKYGMYITSTGDFSGSTGTATNNYGLYVNTPSGADNNYSIYSAGGSNYFTGEVQTGNLLVEKKVTFTPTTVGWYRIVDTTSQGLAMAAGTIKITGPYDNRITDIEMQYDIGGYGTGGSIQETRYSSYNQGVVSQARISSDGGAACYLDIYISSATTPGSVTVYGYGPNQPAFVSSPVVGATVGSTNANTLTLGHGLRTTFGLSVPTITTTGTNDLSNVTIDTATANWRKIIFNGYNGRIMANGTTDYQDYLWGGGFRFQSTEAKTADFKLIDVINQATNTTTDGINKYGMYITSTGSFTGSTGTATNNYGLYVAAPSGADNNYAAMLNGTLAMSGGNLNMDASSVYSINMSNSGTVKTFLGQAFDAGDWIAGSAAGDFNIRNQGGNILLSADSGTTAHMKIASNGTITVSGTIVGNGVHTTASTMVGGLNADYLDGYDASAFGDATAANQTTILSRIGTNSDAASMSDTLFAGQQYIWDNRTSFGKTYNLYKSDGTTLLGPFIGYAGENSTCEYAQYRDASNIPQQMSASDCVYKAQWSIYFTNSDCTGTAYMGGASRYTTNSFLPGQHWYSDTGVHTVTPSSALYSYNSSCGAYSSGAGSFYHAFLATPPYRLKLE
ncbi:MAG: hypothetical protein PHU86_03225 [Patescibacteria group bacterium]|nr:hypothetical protein [Patescibacteria group bacterium]